MAYYYKYNFISPEGVFAQIQEELKSYFDTGVIDSLLFSSYVDKCLRKLGKSSYTITETVLFINDFQARLPDNFYAVREAWLCTQIDGYPYQAASSFYSQAATSTTIQVSPMTINGQPCNDPVCPPGECDPCMPNIVQAVYKTNNEVALTYMKRYMLKPGNISARNACDVCYMENWEAYSQAIQSRQFTPNASSYDSFDIRDNKFVVNFRQGIVHLVFYATDYDDSHNQMVPDNYRILEYIEAFIKYKMFETLSNQVTDETFNQIREKLLYYKALCDEAYVLAEVEIKKQTLWQKQMNMHRHLHRLDRFELPGTNNRYVWGRSGWGRNS